MTDLIDLIKASGSHLQEGIRTMIPARLVSIDYATQRATVEVLIQRRDYNGVVQTLPPITGVPIHTNCEDTGQLSFPVKPGGLGHLIVSDRSIDRYIYSDGVQPTDPADRRMNNITDAVFVPGLRTFPTAYGIDPTRTVLRHNAGVNGVANPGENELALHPVGDDEAITLQGNKNTNELCSIKMNQDGSISITSDEGNSLLSRIHLKNDGSISIDASDGTNISMVQGGKITINTSTEVEVNSATCDVNCSGTVTVDGSTIVLNGGSGGGVVTASSINIAIGVPQTDASGTVFCDY